MARAWSRCGRAPAVECCSPSCHAEGTFGPMDGTRRAAMILICAALSIVAGQASAKTWSRIRIATEGAYPPFNFVAPDGSLQGFEIDLARAICAKEKVECSFVAQDWEGLIPGLLAGKYDLIMASMSITDERRKAIDFSGKYYSSPSVFVIDTQYDGMATDPDAMRGKVVGAQAATVSARYLEEVYGPKGAEVKLYATQDEANLDLVSGRLDVMLADKLVIMPWLQSTDEGRCCKATGRDLDDPVYFGEGIGAGLRKGEVELKALVDRGVEGVRADGDYARINAKYFPFGID